MPSVKIENISPTRKRVVVGVDAKEIAVAEEQVTREIVSEAKLDGFRPGKAPVGLVKARYAKVIADELNNKVIRESYQKALKEAKLDFCAVVDVEGGVTEAKRNTNVVVTVDIYPEIKLPKYKELPVKLTKISIDEKEVTQTIDLIRGQRAQFEPVEREARTGDYVRLNYTGTLDGKLVAELVTDKPIYGTQKNTWEEAGNHDYGIKAISEGVLGMKKDEKKTVVMEFDKKFEVPTIAGKKVIYELELLEVREKKLPEMNEEFFKSVGVKGEAELRTQIRASIEKRAQEEQESAKQEQISEALLKAVGKLNLPESLVQAESQELVNDIVAENQRRGVKDEEIQKNQKELVAKAKEAAERRVKLRMVLREIAKVENLEVTEDDFKRFVMGESMRRQCPPDKVVKELSTDRERMSNLSQALKLGKAMKLLLDSAKIEETDALPDEKKSK